MTTVEGYERQTYTSSAYRGCCQLGTIEKDASGGHGPYAPEAVRGARILEQLLREDFQTVLDVGAGALQHSRILLDWQDRRHGRFRNLCHAGLREHTTQVRNEYTGDFNAIEFPEMYDAVGARIYSNTN